MDFEQAVAQAQKQTGLGVSRASVPDEELVVRDDYMYGKYHAPVIAIVNLNEVGCQQPGKDHKEATDWGVSLHSTDDVRKLGDEIRVAAVAGTVSDELRSRVQALGEVDRLKLWGWCSRDGLNVAAFGLVYATLAHAVMAVFKIPVGAAAAVGRARGR